MSEKRKKESKLKNDIEMAILDQDNTNKIIRITDLKLKKITKEMIKIDHVRNFERRSKLDLGHLSN